MNAFDFIDKMPLEKGGIGNLFGVGASLIQPGKLFQSAPEIPYHQRVCAVNFSWLKGHMVVLWFVSDCKSAKISASKLSELLFKFNVPNLGEALIIQFLTDGTQNLVYVKI